MKWGSPVDPVFDFHLDSSGFESLRLKNKGHGVISRVIIVYWLLFIDQIQDVNLGSPVDTLFDFHSYSQGSNPCDDKISETVFRCT